MKLILYGHTKGCLENEENEENGENEEKGKTRKTCNYELLQ